MILLNNYFQAGKFSIVIDLSVKEVGPACSMLVYLNFINYLINIFRTVQFVRNSLLIKLSVNYFLPPLVNRLKETLFR